MYLAQLAYQVVSTVETLRRCDRVLTASADYMAAYPNLNNDTGRYDRTAFVWCDGEYAAQFEP
jgi:hypothetical protein